MSGIRSRELDFGSRATAARPTLWVRTRAVVRLAAVAVETILFYGLWILARPGTWLWPRGRGRLRRAIVRAWGRSTCALLCVHIRTDGPRSPRGLVVANHLGYLDVVVLAAELGPRFVAKAEIAQWPVLGRMARSVDTIFVQRERKRGLGEVQSEIESALAHDDHLVLFAEGTSSDGRSVLPFRAALLEPAAIAHSAVQAAALGFATGRGAPRASLAVAWWGDMELLPHLFALAHHERIEARVVFSERTVVEGDRKRLAQRLHADVLRLHRPLE